MNEYTIYSHEDTDGGISAAIFARFIKESYPGWNVQVNPVGHKNNPGDDWSYQEISFPCAILDFSLHGQFLNQRFFEQANAYHRQKIPQCFWIDHHPTGSFWNLLTPENAQEMIPDVKVKWDTSAISTPGLFRTHHQELGIPQKLLETYEAYIDLAEIVDGALFATPEAAFDFHHPAVRLASLFSTRHPAINHQSLYKRVVKAVMMDPDPENLLDFDPIYRAIIEHEMKQVQKQMRVYERNTKKIGNLTYSNFWTEKQFAGLGRFIPYILFPEAEYGIHLLPRNNGYGVITCGINPWNKPLTSQKHIGNFFVKHFRGGGHSFVAGGKVHESELKNVEKLIEYLRED